MLSEERLNETFSEVGKEFGYDEVKTEFAAYTEFKVRWERSQKWANFKVSDYVEEADCKVLEGLARTIFSKIVGDEVIPYSEAMCQYIKSDKFVKENQPVYIRRSRKLTGSQEGDNRNLKDSYERLIEMGLAKRDEQILFSWTKEPDTYIAGYCSPTMKVIAISSVLDSEDVPEFVLDYAVYHELIHAKQGMKLFGKMHDEEFEDAEDRYPKKKEAENWLQKLCLGF